jgi:hypothetical protein
MRTLCVAAALVVLSAGQGACSRNDPVPPRDDPEEAGGAAAAIDPEPLVDLSRAGSLTGRVTFEGAAPPRRILRTQADLYCSSLHEHDPLYSEDLLVGEGGSLRNVVLSLARGLEGKGRFPVPRDPLVLDQVGCRFVPHVATLVAGQILLARNSDDTLHTVHSHSRLNREFNKPQSQKGQADPIRLLRKPEVVRIGCDAHDWMVAYVHVFEHPCAAVSGVDGTYAIGGIPPGTYTVQAWHEVLGTQSLEVRVLPGETVVRDLSFRMR